MGFNVKGLAARERVGGNERVTHIHGHIAMQREAARTPGEKDLVLKKLYVLAAQNPDETEVRPARQRTVCWTGQSDKFYENVKRLNQVGKRTTG